MNQSFLERLKWKASARNRQKKLSYIRDHISNTDSILDIGVFAIDRQSGPGTNYLEEYFLETNRMITALGLNSDDYSLFTQRYSNCELHLFDGFTFPSFLEPFDIAISNAVIEHVGDYEKQVRWMKGIHQVCKKLIITTPNRYFPVEAHTNTLFLHWLKPNTRQKLLKLLHMPANLYEDLYLLSRKDFISILQKSGFKIKEVKHNRLLFLTLDFVIIAEA